MTVISGVITDGYESWTFLVLTLPDCPGSGCKTSLFLLSLLEMHWHLFGWQEGHLSAFQRPFSRWTWVSRCLLKQRIMEMLVTTGATSRAKLQSNHHHQQTNTQSILQAGCPSCHPTNNVKALKGKISFHGLAYPKLNLGVFLLCLWPLTARGYLGGALPCLSSALWCQYPWL